MRRADDVRWSTTRCSRTLLGRLFVLAPDGTPRSEAAYGVRFLFTGREYLAPVGLYDYRHRAYSASLGRFLQVDPLRLVSGGRDLYSYCNNLPALLNDVLGCQPFTEDVVAMRDVAHREGLRVGRRIHLQGTMYHCSRERFLKYLAYLLRIQIPQRVEVFLKDPNRPRWIPQSWWPHAGTDSDFYSMPLVNLEGRAHVGEDVNYVAQGMLAVLLDTPGLALVIGRKAAALEIPPTGPTLEFYQLGKEYAQGDWEAVHNRLQKLFGHE